MSILIPIINYFFPKSENNYIDKKREKGIRKRQHKIYYAVVRKAKNNKNIFRVVYSLQNDAYSSNY